ncbi:hypothetical protein BVRB_011390 [Beta vulgaris subsp. vulgaris]|uniref:Uncharacterized protein n=1 Tax=Beta vulgaris subsp. vulgaris TaxID=3555 RepID=A0A0J8B287_BETVV|nr:hypothetical protein BVRB_011390 [Beta vulgaris subsp. vulgaris]
MQNPRSTSETTTSSQATEYPSSEIQFQKKRETKVSDPKLVIKAESCSSHLVSLSICQSVIILLISYIHP